MHTPFFWGWGGGVEPLANFSKRREGVTRSQFLEGVAGKERGDFFSGGCSFYIKNKLKSQIFNNNSYN